MEDKFDSTFLKNNFSALKDTMIDRFFDGHTLRSFSCTCQFFSSSLKESMKQKPIWQIIAGFEQTFIFNLQTGELYGIGSNEYYSLGKNIYPIGLINKIPLSEQIVPFELFVGAFQSFILSKDGVLYGTGRNSSSELAKIKPEFAVPFRKISLENVRSVAVMGTATLFLSNDNEIYSTEHGELKLANKIVKQMEAGYYHALILCKDRSLYRYGVNYEGSPFEEITIPNLDIKTVRAKGSISLILTNDNQLYFADHSKGKTFNPLVLPKDIKIKNVYLGVEHIIIQSTHNKLFGFGSNKEGQLGLGKEKLKIDSFEEIILPTEPKIHYVVTGFYYSFVICENDEIYGFGDAHNQLGEEKGSCHFSPKRLSLIDEVKMLASVEENKTESSCTL